MPTLVTGATGFLGSQLCRRLVARGEHVRALHRATSDLSVLHGVNVEWVLGDLLDARSLISASRGCRSIFHCGGLVARWQDPALMIASHTSGTGNLLLAAKLGRVESFVHVSSVAALGVPAPGSANKAPSLMSEASLWNYDAARWPYGYAKHRTEMAVMEAVAAGLRAVIVNPSVVLGPGDVHRREDSIVELIAHRSLPPLIPPGGLNAIHIQDVLDGMLAARQRGVPGRRYILGGENVSIPDFIARISRAVGIDRRYREIPASLFQLAGIIGGLIDRLQVLPVPTSMLAMAGMHFYYDTGRMNGELKVQASRPIEQAALEAHAWYSHRSSHTAGR